MLEKAEWGHRIIAFLDILGFKELIKDAAIQQKILDILYSIRSRNSSSKVEKIADEDGKKTLIYPTIMSFSDHIIISMRIDKPEIISFEVALQAICRTINSFYREALPLGILLRGAIAVGNVYCDKENNIIFGAPLIEAIEDESSLAIYPRVIISKSLSHVLGIVDRKGYLLSRRDLDGMFYIDYFMAFFQGQEQKEKNSIQIASIIRDEIQRNITLHKTNLKILSKWLWLANYYDVQLAVWRLNAPEYNSIKAFDLSEYNFENLRAKYVPT